MSSAAGHKAPPRGGLWHQEVLWRGKAEEGFAGAGWQQFGGPEGRDRLTNQPDTSLWLEAGSMEVPS